MFKRSFRQVLVVAFGLTLSGVAFARNPHVLVKQQATSQAAASAGYRDINLRFGVVPARTPEVIRAAGGYRDIHYRFANFKAAGQLLFKASHSRYWKIL